MRGLGTWLGVCLLLLTGTLAGGPAAARSFLMPEADDDAGSLVITLPAPEADGTSLRVLHAARLSNGLGSNPLGLDRGWGNSGEILRFRLRGDRVTAEVENQLYRATADNPLEQRAVAESFGRSVIWSGKIASRLPNGGATVDITGLLTADTLGLARQLTEDDAKDFKLNKDSALLLTGDMLSFPDNLEIDAELTFESEKPGPEVRATAPDPRAVTLTVHHSLSRLPDDGYSPRAHDPRMGVNALGYYDFSAPLTGEVVKAWAIRHRLRHNIPGDPGSGTKDPIIFYVDPGAPPQIRDALIEGASWWRDAFAAAGFPDGYRVELLPDGANPLDIRYNVIQWVHRQTRGWSYGGGIVDPRTGEMVKGHVILGSQRVRQDRMIFEGLAGTAKSGTGADDDPVELSLDRIRQLAAHEVAHALGFAHNFAASTYGRGSVSDYPAPWVIAREDGTLDFSRSYAAGIGPWDKAAATWLYGDFGTNEAAELERVADETRAAGLVFVEDDDARGVGTGHARGAVWDNGDDPVAELANTLRVREIALANFGERSLSAGQNRARLREVIVPIYLYHRYQLASAAKSIGGTTYQYTKAGDPDGALDVVHPDRQAQAIALVLQTLEPEFLDLPQGVLAALPPAPSAPWGTARPELFDARTAPAFDLFSAAETSVDLTLDALLAPARLERMAFFHSRDREHPAPADLLRRIGETVTARPREQRRQALADVATGRLVARLIDADDGSHSDLVSAALRAELAQLRRDIAKRADVPLAALWTQRIDAHLSRPAPDRTPVPRAPDIPPGSPIGG